MMRFFKRKTKIRVNYTLCGDGIGVDPRACRKCLLVCEPAVFLLHQSFDVQQADDYDPDKWRITPLWLSLCTKCYQCVHLCPEGAISVE